MPTTRAWPTIVAGALLALLLGLVVVATGASRSETRARRGPSELEAPEHAIDSTACAPDAGLGLARLVRSPAPCGRATALERATGPAALARPSRPALVPFASRGGARPALIASNGSGGSLRC